MQDRPSVVYKYESINVQSLINLKAQSIYFGSPRNFNDPYDCALTASAAELNENDLELLKNHYLHSPTTPEAVKQEIASLPALELGQKLMNAANLAITGSREIFLDTKGVSCFSELNDNLLMWAHYGGRYKGFCLEFLTGRPPFYNLLHEVKYVDEMPKIDIANFVLNEDVEKLINLFCTKSSSWKYEKEWRAIHDEVDTGFTYDADALSGIYFGPDIEQEALEIICLIIQGQNPSVKFYKSRRSTTAFKLEFESFTYTSFIEARRNGKV